MRLYSLLVFSLFSVLAIVFAVLLARNITLPQLPKREEKTIIKTDAIVSITPDQMEQALVKKVIDGDTIELHSGQKVRYVGIDTPETKHPQKGVECFGREAYQQNRKIVEGELIYLQKDVSEKDRYDRLLRYIYLPIPNATGEALFVNRYLVEEGYAHALTYPPDVKYDQLFRQMEASAREQKKGLWQKCEE